MPPKRGTPKKCAAQEAATAARQAQVGDLGHTSDPGSALSRCTTRSSSNHSTTVWCTPPTPERSSEHHQADEARLRAGLAPLPMSSLLQQTVAHGVEPSEVAVAVDGEVSPELDEPALARMSAERCGGDVCTSDLMVRIKVLVEESATTRCLHGWAARPGSRHS